MTTRCPHCDVDLHGSPIPEKYRDGYGGATHYMRTIGVEIRGEYDGVLFWRCPDCLGTWHRWPVGTDYYDRAAKYMLDPM